jgi:hypothetical protein
MCGRRQNQAGIPWPKKRENVAATKKMTQVKSMKIDFPRWQDPSENGTVRRNGGMMLTKAATTS